MSRTRPELPPGLLRRRLKLRQLELLAALKDGATLSQAARELHLSQPAASRLLGAAALALGVALFEPAGRSLRPTTVGRALIRHAARIVAELDRAQGELAALRDGRIGSTNLGAGAGACYALVPRALARLHSAAPQMEVQLSEGPMEELLARLRERRLDLVVGRIDARALERDIASERLYDPQIRIVVGAEHPLGRARRLDWKQLLEQEWILPQAGTPMREFIERMFRRAGAWPARAPIRSSSISANVMLLRSRNLVWPVSADIAAPYVAAGMLRVLPLTGLRGSGALLMLWRQGEALSPAAQQVLECLRAAGQEIGRRSS